MSPSKVKVVVAISGGGRTLKNLLEKQLNVESCYEIVGVISSSLKSKGIQFAEDHGLPLFIGDFVRDQTRVAAKLRGFLDQHQPKLIALAGFLSPFPLDHPLWDKVINIHPALLPKFGGKGMYGMNIHREVIKAQEAFSGATVHKVTKDYDEGRILAQVQIPVNTHDPKELAAKVFQAECDLYPRILNKICQMPKIDLDLLEPDNYNFRLVES